MDIYTIIFLALAVVICLRLRSVLGQHTVSEGPPYLTGILLTLTAAALGAVIFDVGGAKQRFVGCPTDCVFALNSRRRPRG